MPSPVAERPGLLIRDTFQYSDSVLIVPPLLVRALTYFDGEHTELDLRAYLVEATGDVDVSPIISQLVTALSNSGFVEDERFETLRTEAHQRFRENPVREAAHAGSAYPEGNAELASVMARYLGQDGMARKPAPIAIAAPHVSPEGGWQSYRAAYGELSPEMGERTFVVLGTSHYGYPERFGLTRKPYVTPFGAVRPALDLIERLADQPAALMEDYCHAVEHSIEFQVLFLQSIFGPEIRVLPVLCGCFARSLELGGKPEEDEGVARFLDALGELHVREGKRLAWVLGIDMAHMGRRYGDRLPAIAHQDGMQAVAERDVARIARMNEGDADGFWELVQENRDDLKWCGSAPAYTFLKAVPNARGALRRYEQWNIDEQSVVSFAGISFLLE